MNASDKLELQLSEEADGSVVVTTDDPTIANKPEETPTGGAAATSTEPGGEGVGTGGGDGDDDHHADDDRGIAADATDAEREAIRAARREERRLKKQLQREKARESNHLIETLRRQNEQLVERLSVVEKRTAGAELARLDKAIEDGHLKLQYAKVRMAEATASRDGKALADATEQWYEARRTVESLENMKKRATSEPRAERSVPNAPDLTVQRKAASWMEKNSWYDPNGKDPDSKIASTIDEALTQEGWDPKTEEYWEELDERLTKYLPHRYNGGQRNNRSTQSNIPRGPKAVVTGSGREAPSTARPGEFRLSPERVRAIKEAGKWDDPTERQKMIRKYAEYDRQQPRN